MSLKSENIRIVVAEKKHIADCLDSLCDCTIGERYFSDKEYARRLIESGIKKKEIFIGAGANREVAGFYWPAAAGMFCSFPYLRILSVKPRFRNLGVGRRLLDHFEKNGFKQASRVFLAVSDFNADARRFYRRNGYVRVGVLPGLFKPGISEILMMKSSS